MQTTKTAPRVEHGPAHGLFQPVIVSTNLDLCQQFMSVLNTLLPDRHKNYQNTFNVQQDGATVVFTAHFHDEKNSYKLEFEAERRVK